MLNWRLYLNQKKNPSFILELYSKFCVQMLWFVIANIVILLVMAETIVIMSFAADSSLQRGHFMLRKWPIHHLSRHSFFYVFAVVQNLWLFISFIDWGVDAYSCSSGYVIIPQCRRIQLSIWISVICNVITNVFDELGMRFWTRCLTDCIAAHLMK